MVQPKTVQHHSNTARRLLLCCVETSPHFSGQSITESVHIKTPLKTPYSPIHQSCSLTLQHIFLLLIHIIYCQLRQQGHPSWRRLHCNSSEHHNTASWPANCSNTVISSLRSVSYSHHIINASIQITSFYPCDAMLARVIVIATCLSVRLSVCPSHAGIVSKRRKLASWFLHHLVAPRL